MKLFHSPTSPYVRKVMACAVARGLEGRIEIVPTNPHQSPPGLLAVNPLSRVPALVRDDGGALFDSPVICEYLDSLG
ncbi:MAG: glutathione S-transferase N-terminal domain-containing protein, partial [Acetobacteraceae bacterium]